MQDPDNTGYSSEFQWEALLSWVPLKTPASVILKPPLSFQQPWPTAPKRTKRKYNKKSFLSIDVKIFSNSPLLFIKITYL